MIKFYLVLNRKIFLVNTLALTSDREEVLYIYVVYHWTIICTQSIVTVCSCSSFESCRVRLFWFYLLLYSRVLKPRLATKSGDDSPFQFALAGPLCTPHSAFILSRWQPMIWCYKERTVVGHHDLAQTFHCIVSAWSQPRTKLQSG